MSLPLWRRCGAEGLGAAVIVLADLGSGVLHHVGLLPEAFSLVLVPGVAVMILIYLLSDLSGAHFNPAVTVAFALRGSFRWREVPAYLGAQLLGTLVAAGVLREMGALGRGTERVVPGQAWGLEVAATTLLVMVVLATSKRKATLGPESGLVVGSTVALAHALAGPLTAVTLNPARSLGPALVRGDAVAAWPHWLGPLCGALVAVVCTWVLRGPANAEEEQAAQGTAQS